MAELKQQVKLESQDPESVIGKSLPARIVPPFDIGAWDFNCCSGFDIWPFLFGI